MRFLVITFAPLLESDSIFYSYGPYVTEMNIWLKYPEEVAFCCPTKYSGGDLLMSSFDRQDIKVYPVPELMTKDILKPWKLIESILQLRRGIRWADHIHLRCPGNIGLLGCLVQIFFPVKQKTAKYAGNWDWKSKQPWSYRMQQRILRNTFLTRNMTALVYGEWPERTKNTKPFFTASYSEKECIPVHKTFLNEGVKLAFVGTLTENKNPLASAEVLLALTEKGIRTTLTCCGDGPERQKIEKFIDSHRLHDKVNLMKNVDSETVKKVLQEAHFLIFLSRSEGWPKAVSEAMWWGCLPITTPVSCVPWMLGNGARGELVNGEITGITSLIEGYIADQNSFNSKSGKAMDWSREYTTEKFKEEIKEFLTK